MFYYPLETVIFERKKFHLCITAFKQVCHGLVLFYSYSMYKVHVNSAECFAASYLLAQYIKVSFPKIER